jgi:hypothetical protein
VKQVRDPVITRHFQISKIRSCLRGIVTELNDLEFMDQFGDLLSDGDNGQETDNDRDGSRLQLKRSARGFGLLFYI